MKALILLASAGVFAMAAPAVAEPHHGMHGMHHSDRDNWRHRDRDESRMYHSSRMSSHYGRHDNGHHYGWYKHNRRWSRGDHWRSTYGTYYSYNRIPYRIRQQYDLNNDYRYYYNNGYLYGVDPRTMLVQQVISALLR